MSEPPQAKRQKLTDELATLQSRINQVEKELGMVKRRRQRKDLAAPNIDEAVSWSPELQKLYRYLKNLREFTHATPEHLEKRRLKDNKKPKKKSTQATGGS